MEPIFKECKEHFDRLVKRIDDDIPKSERCLNCGTEIHWSERQWRQSCQCGVMLVRNPKVAVTKTQEPKCWICMDTGIVEYLVQREGAIGKYVSGCACEANEYPGIPKFLESLYAPSKEFIYSRNVNAWKQLIEKT